MPEWKGELKVFCQEGGFAAAGVTIDGVSIGDVLLDLAGQRESARWRKARVTVVLDGEPEGEGVGYFNQVQIAPKNQVPIPTETFLRGERYG